MAESLGSEIQAKTFDSGIENAYLDNDLVSGVIGIEEVLEQDNKLDPVAVIGLSLKFPQNATSPEGFWQMLADGVSASTEIPVDRFRWESFYDDDFSRTGTMNVKSGHFVKEDIAAFDAQFFSITPAEAACMDPQQRWLLEIAYRALENAGIPLEKVAGSKTSVHIGSFTNDYGLLLQKDTKTQAKYFATGTEPGMLANRLSWFYDLRGPSMQLDTACSSSLNALHLACQSLRNRDSDMGIVGGCNLILNPESMFALTDLNFLSPDGKSYAFDERANGYARGEGAGIVVIKLLSDALRDGDCVRAVIRATGSNQDGRTPNITQPSAEAQATLIRDTYQTAGLSLKKTRYFEAHGTGTPLGDPVEATAINASFGEHRTHESPLLVGALKSNIGHLEGASGIASLIKTILVLEKGVIPRNIWFEHVNPNISLENRNIEFPTHNLPWPTTGLRRASINSFGFGGSNAHAVLDDAYNYLRLRGLSGNHCSAICPPNLFCRDPSANNDIHDIYTPSSKATSGSPVLLVFSAYDEAGLQRLASAYRSYLSRPSAIIDDHRLIQDLSFTLAKKRSVLPWKSFVLASVSDLQSNLEKKISKPIRSSEALKLGFVFTGQGAHWSTMGKELLRYPTFKASLVIAGKCFQGLGCTWSLIDEILKEDETSNLNDPAFSQPICTALQIAIIHLLWSWNIEPAAVVGHSSGEIAAAFCAGSIDQESAWRLAYYRGVVANHLRLLNREAESMMSVGLSETDMGLYLRETMLGCRTDAISIGCINSPRNVTVSGNKVQIHALQGKLLQDDILARVLNVDTAYHSKSMDKVASQYLMLLEGTQVSPSTGKTSNMFSSVTGKRILPDELRKAQYWVRNMTSQVRFSDAVTEMCTQSSGKLSRKVGGQTIDSTIDYILEIGPHAALRAPIRDILFSNGKLETTGYGSILIKGRSALDTAMTVAGHLHCLGCAVDLTETNDLQGSRSPKMLADLPEYPFDHRQKYWIESRLSKNFRFRKNAEHELLGSTVPDWNPLDARWRNIIKLSENEWMADHKVHGTVIYPAAAVIIMATEAAQMLASPNQKIIGYTVRNVNFIKAVMLSPDPSGTEIQFGLRPLHDISSISSMWWQFQLWVYENGEWLECCRGIVVVEYNESVIAPIESKEHEKGVHYYTTIHRRGTARCKTTVRSKDLYENLTSMGLEYGPTFQVLGDVAVSQENAEATATISPCNWKDDADETSTRRYVLHPSALDGIFQLMFPALANGKKSSEQTRLPTRMESLWITAKGISGHATSSKLQVHAKGAIQGYRDAEFSMTALDSQTGIPAVLINGFQSVSLANPFNSDSESSRKRLCYNIAWKPDFRLLKNQEISTYCEKSVDRVEGFKTDLMSLAAHLFIVKTLNVGVRENELSSQPHLRKYFQWMKYANEHLGAATLKFGDYTWRDLVSNPEHQREFFQTMGKSRSPQTMLIVKVGKHLTDILTGKTDALGLLFDDDLLEKVYSALVTDTATSKLAVYLDVHAHTTPDMEILEVGAGTGSMTKFFLHTLVHHGEGERGTARFAHYTFTDISPSFFEKARGIFEGNEHRATFKILNVEQDPTEQGYECGMYDVVVAANVIHATRSLANSLQNIRKLLKPGGTLIMLELTNPDDVTTTFAMGLLPGWWLSTENFRKRNPLVDPEQWHKLLSNNGFSGVDIHWPDHPDSQRRLSSVMIATASDYEMRASDALTRITVVADNSIAQQAIAQDLATRVAKTEKLDCHVVALQDMALHTWDRQHCIFLPELHKPLVFDMTKKFFSDLQKLIRSASIVVWVTNGRDETADGPNSSIVVGLARTIKSELSDVKFVTVALQNLQQSHRAADHILRVYTASATAMPNMYEPEFEEINGVLHINRIVEANYLCHHIAAKTIPQVSFLQKLGQEPYRRLALTIGSVGLLDTLKFTDDSPSIVPLASDEIEVEVKASGLIFRDILIASGLYNDTSFGLEYAGIIITAGCEVPMKVGDRVYGWTHGSFKTHARCKAVTALKIPDDMSFNRAVAFLVGHCTAYHSLVSLAQIQDSESVLIHSGAGGTGQAAVQMAKYFNAEIFVTVGNAEKKKLLVDLYGIPEDHIFSSRTLSFKDGIKSMTQGRGVNIVLNSLSGEAFLASLECVAPFGRFIELGRGNTGNLSIATLSSNIMFATVDLSFMMLQNPSLLGDLMKATVRFVADKTFTEPKPLNVYRSSHLEDAFRYMQSGKNVGKIVIEMNKEDMVPTTQRVTPAYSFDENATYVIAGGLGGIGRSIARWMANRNARNFILLSRSANYSEDTQALIDELRDQGANVATPPCDVSDKESLARTLRECGQSLPPIKGCIQSSLALNDKPFDSMSLQEFNVAIKPKVQGSWNLHDLLPKTLDFFVLLSSVVGIVGSRSQANYACGNVYQDRLARYRIAQNLKAVAIDIGLVRSVGFTAERDDVMRNLTAQGYMSLTEQDLHAILDYHCDPAVPPASTLKSQVVTGLQTPTALRAAGIPQSYWLDRPLFRHLLQIGKGDAVSEQKMPETAVDYKSLLSTARSLDDAGEIICGGLVTKLSKLLGIPVNNVNSNDQAFVYGADSLSAIEIRHWLSKEMGAEVSVFMIIGNQSIAEVALIAAGSSHFVPTSLRKEKEAGT